MKKALAFLVPALFLTLNAALFAQAPAPDKPADKPAEKPADKAPRRILFVMEKGGLFSSYSDSELIILKRSFLTVLADMEGAPVPIDYSLKSFPGSLEARNKAARDAGADCWLVVKVVGKGKPTLDVVSFDLLYNIKTLDYSVAHRDDISMLDVYRERWDDVIPRVVKTYPPIVSHAYTRGPPGPVTLTIRAAPGTTIKGFPGQAVSVGQDGSARVELPSPAPYTFRATAFGYVPKSMEIYLDGQTDLALEQVRSPWVRLDAALQDGFFPSISGSFSIPSLPFFARLQFTTFRVGASVNSSSFFTSFPYSQSTFLLGYYMTPEDQDTRWYFGAGFILRTTLPAGGSFGLDPLIPYGVEVAEGCDFPLAGALRAFVEFTPSLYFSTDPDAFYNSFGKNGPFPYIIFKSGPALDLLEFRFGVRLPL